MLAAREPALFKCAVGYAGIYHLNLLYKEYGARRDNVAMFYEKLEAFLASHIGK
jgi:hypothetical protein